MSDTFKIGQKLTWYQSRKWGGKQGVPVVFVGYVGKTGNRAKIETVGIEPKHHTVNVRFLKERS